MSVKALLFDLDDTLYEYAPCNRRALQAAREILSEVLKVSSAEFRDLHDKIRGELAVELSGQAASHNRAIFFKRMVEEFVGSSNPQLVAKMYQEYWQAFYETVQPQVDAVEVLSHFRKSYRLALISNHTTLPQLGKISALGLEGFFEVVVTSEEAGVEKPVAHIFQMALARLGVCAHEAVMIGDDVIGDISGAAALGISPIQTIEFTEAVESEQADHVVTQLGELLDISL